MKMKFKQLYLLVVLGFVTISNLNASSTTTTQSSNETVFDIWEDVQKNFGKNLNYIRDQKIKTKSFLSPLQP